MLRGMEGKWLKMASERRTDYKKYTYTGCDGFARYSERVSTDIAGLYRLQFLRSRRQGLRIAVMALSEVLPVRAGRRRSGNTAGFRLLGIFRNISGRTFFCIGMLEKKGEKENE